jgi:hypothetical protein
MPTRQGGSFSKNFRTHDLALRIVGPQQAPTFMALTCRWRSRPQHRKQTSEMSFDELTILLYSEKGAPKQKIAGRSFDDLIRQELEFASDGQPLFFRRLQIDDEF